jgi:hypothetical protein
VKPKELGDRERGTRAFFPFFYSMMCGRRRRLCTRAHVLPPRHATTLHSTSRQAALPVIPSKPRKKTTVPSRCLSLELRWRPASVFLPVLAPFPPTASAAFQGNFFRGPRPCPRADAAPSGFSRRFCPLLRRPAGVAVRRARRLGQATSRIEPDADTWLLVRMALGSGSRFVLPGVR